MWRKQLYCWTMLNTAFAVIATLHAFKLMKFVHRCCHCSDDLAANSTILLQQTRIVRSKWGTLVGKFVCVGAWSAVALVVCRISKNIFTLCMQWVKDMQSGAELSPRLKRWIRNIVIFTWHLSENIKYIGADYRRTHWRRRVEKRKRLGNQWMAGLQWWWTGARGPSSWKRKINSFLPFSLSFFLSHTQIIRFITCSWYFIELGRLFDFFIRDREKLRPQKRK